MRVRDPVVGVVVAVGSALVVLFVGAGVVLALGKPVPTELWAAASALSGALVAMLVPPTNTSAGAVRTAAQAARDETHRQAVSAAKQKADELKADAAKPGASPEAKHTAKAAADAVSDVMRDIPSAATLDLAARQATGSAQAAVAAATAIASDAVRRAADDAAAREHEARQSAPAASAVPAQRGAASHTSTQPPQQTADASQQDGAGLSAAVARSQVLEAAAAGAENAHAGAIVAGLDAVDAAGKSWFDKVDPKIVLTLLVGVVAFGVGIWLATKTGKDTSANATQYDAALKGAADTLIALGSAAVGAALGLKAPRASANQSG